MISGGEAEAGERRLTAACHPARNVVIVEAVDTFQIPAVVSEVLFTADYCLHLSPSPLHLLHDV